MNPVVSRAVREGLESMRAHRGTFAMDLLGGRHYAASPCESGWTVEGFHGITTASELDLLASTDRLYLCALTGGKNPSKVVEDVAPSDVVRVTVGIKGTSLDLYTLDLSDVMSGIIERMDENPGSCVCVELDDGNRILMTRCQESWHLSTRAEDGSPVRKDVGPRVAIHGTPYTLEVLWDFDRKDRPMGGFWFEKSSVVAVSYADATSTVPRTCWEVSA